MENQKEIKISSSKIRESVQKDYREALAFTILIYKMNPNTIFTITREELGKQLRMSSRKVNHLLDAAQRFSLIQYDKDTFRIQRFKLSSSRNNFKLDPDKLTSFTVCEHWIIKCILMEAFDFVKFIHSLFKYRYNPTMKGQKIHELYKKAKKILRHSKYIAYNYFGSSYESMAKKVEVSKSTIRSIIREMIKEGLIISKPNYKVIKCQGVEITKYGLYLLNQEKIYHEMISDKEFNHTMFGKGFFRVIKGRLCLQFANLYDVLNTSNLPKKNIFDE